MAGLILAAVAGFAFAGGPRDSAQLAVVAADAAPAAERTRATSAPDPARLEGASALAGATFLIPPPRWLASHPARPRTARLRALAPLVYPDVE
ncbi:MAG: hypothetical protein ACJ77F_09380 [Chloroflexota bacterium]